MRYLVGFIVGLLAVPAGVYAYFRWGSPPVAAGDPLLPFEQQIVSVPLRARIDREMPKNVPVTADEAAYVVGAKIYGEQCSGCHGLPGHDAAVGKLMFPHAPQLFAKHGDHVGVSDDPPGETYWKVANGIRLSGMPAFKSMLNETEMWQVTLLLANADKLPPAVSDRLTLPK